MLFSPLKKSRNKEPKVQECDATDDEKGTTDGTIIKNKPKAYHQNHTTISYT